MKNFLKFIVIVLSLGLFMHSSWGAPAKKCPADVNLTERGFMKAHGIANMKDYSIWLKEHSIWRRKYQDELENYSFIPQQPAPERHQ